MKSETLKTPQRIVSLAPSNTEILYQLGVADRLLAVTRYCDYPEQAAHKPAVGGWVDIMDTAVAEHQPDLLITSTCVQEKIAAKYTSLGYEVLHVDPTTLDGVYDSILKIGNAVGAHDQAAQIVADMKKQLAALQKKLEHLTYAPRVYVEEWNRPPTAAGNWVPDLIDLACGQALLRKGERSRAVGLQEIKAFDPEIIIISLCGFKDAVDKRLITERPGWQELSAVKNDKVFVLDDSLLNRPGPRLVAGAEKIAEIMHPAILKLKPIAVAQHIKEIKAEYQPNWVEDPLGYFLIKLDRENKKIVLGFCREKNVVELTIEGANSRAIIQEVLKNKLLSRYDHASYLGRELFKAEIALAYGSPYTQDSELVLQKAYKAP